MIFLLLRHDKAAGSIILLHFHTFKNLAFISTQNLLTEKYAVILPKKKKEAFDLIDPFSQQESYFSCLGYIWPSQGQEFRNNKCIEKEAA